MQITCLALEQHLNNHAPQLCLIWGPETHWVEESKKILLQHFALHKAQPLEKLFIHFEQPDKALSQLMEAIQAPSLFSDQKLMVCVVNNTLTPSHRKTLANLLLQLPDSYSLIMQFEKISSSQQKEAWYQHFLKQGVVVTHWPLTPVQYKQYLSQRALKLGCPLTPPALQLIAQMTEGNVLAGLQTLEKIKLNLDDRHACALSENDVLPLIHQDARYTLNDLYNALLENDAQRTHLILENFKETKTPLPLLAWGLHQLLQAVSAPFFPDSGLYPAPVLPKLPSFQHLIEKKQKQYSLSLVMHFINALHQLDKQLKSYHSEQQCWQSCFIFCLQFANWHKTFQNVNLGL